MYPQMLDDGTYDKDYALSIMAVGGTLGPMIPPSTPLIIYAILTGSSIGNVFLGVAIPGIIMCIIYCITAYLIMRKRNMGTNKHEMEKSLKNFWLTFKDGVWALLSPVLILGGIYSGICSPTEAAALACLYALIIGIFVYKELNIKKFYKSMFNATKSAASIMFLIANAMFFGWVMTVQGIPAMVTNVLLLLVDTPVAFLILINVIYLIAGMFMDCGCIILLVVPLMFPMARQLGINDVHFGAITCINLCLGAITPPFGACMFVASSIDKNVKLESIYKEVIPFCIFGTVGILIVTFMPILSTWML
jgi:C4-dicarboxylate transporter DctM subunit